MSARSLIGLFGATGYTGRLVAQALDRLAVPWVAIGRNPGAIDEVRAQFEHCAAARVADTAHPQSLTEAFEGCRVIISAVGPFEHHGLAALDAALAVGAHWTDTSAEQPWTRQALARNDRARKAGCVVLPANGCIYAFHHAASAYLAQRLGPLRAVDSYLWLDHYDPTRGTAVSALAASRSRPLTLRNAALKTAPASVHRIALAGRSGHAVPLSGAEVILLPQAHPQLREARTWLVLSAFEAYGFLAGTVLGPSLPERVLQFANGGVRNRLVDPSPERRADARFTVCVRTSGARGVGTARIDGSDVYGITGESVALTAAALIQAEPRTLGTQTLDQVIDMDAWWNAMHTRGITLTMEGPDGQAHAA